MRRAAALATVVALAGGCDPRDFDNLADSTWVDSSKSPSALDSTDYGAAIAYGGSAGDGTRFAVASLAPPGLATVSFAADGARESSGVLVSDTVPGGVLRGRPALAGDPDGGDGGTLAVGVLEDSGASRIVLARAASLETIEAIPIQGAGGVADALAFAASDAGDPATVDLVALGGGSLSIVADYLGTQSVSTCEIGRARGFAAAAGDFDSGRAGDEVAVAVGSDGGNGDPSELILTAGAAVAAASGGSCHEIGVREPLASRTAPADEPDFGAAIAVADFDGSGVPDLAVGAPSTSTVYLWMNVDVAAADPGAPTELPGPDGSAQFGYALAAGDLDGSGTAELVVGDPGRATGGVDEAGAAHIYTFDGGEAAPPVELADASPEAGQRFGRALAVARFGDSETVLAVGAESEVFTYFRTPLSGDADARLR